LAGLLQLRANAEKSVQYFTLAAAQNFPTALFALGSVYRYGRKGVRKNSTKSKEYFKKAWEMGDVESKTILDEMTGKRRRGQ